MTLCAEREPVDNRATEGLPIRRPTVSGIVLFLALTAATPQPGASREKKAGSPPAPETPTLVERATVELVLIEAYVTDSQGRPIEGLRPDDFVLAVDAHVKPISSLEFRTVEAPAAASPAGAPAAPGTAPLPPAHKRNPRRFILFYEDGTSSPEGLSAARRATERFLTESLQPDDQVALAAYDRGLRLLHDFTPDRQVLRQSVEASLADLRRFSDFASEHAAHESEFAAREFGGSGDGPADIRARMALVYALNYADDEAPRWRGVLKALRTLIDSLAPYPGYKAIVFMGDGVAENPAFDFFLRLARSNPSPELLERARKFDLSLEIEQLATSA